MRWVGDYVAFVVAETCHQALDAAELIEVDYEPLPAVISTADASKPGAPRVWDGCADNIGFVQLFGDKAATDAAFAKADARGQASLRDQPRHRRHHGAARLHRRLQFDRRPLHHLHHAAARASVPLRAVADPEGAREPDPRGRRRYRRQLRHEVGGLQRGRAGAARLEGDRPAGEVGEHAVGGVPRRRAGARQRHRGRARARQGRQVPRAAREGRRRHRRLSADRHERLHAAISARSPASTASRPRTPTSPRCSPTPIRCGPIAATAGPRPPT